MSDIETRLTEALTGRYAIERELGEGGMATVYLARDLRHNRSVAIKVLKPELAAVVGADRFLAEIETTANLQHPHILPLFDSGEADGFLFYVMPYVEGETLRDRLNREGQLPVDEAVGMASSIANALQTAHEQGIVHRDIKPANILLSRGEPLVADFGIALAVHAGGGGRMTETGLSLGTPYYMSPEQATGDQAVGPPSDIYALGSVLYEMLIGEPPYPGNSAQAVLGKILQGAPPSATATRRSIPLNVDGAILKALEKLPADRFATARDFANALSNPAFRYGAGSEATGVSSRRSRTLVGALGAAALLLGAALVWSLTRTPAPAESNRFALDIPEATPEDMNLGVQGRLSISPDGRRIVFVGPGPDFDQQLWLRELGQLEARPIPGTEGANNPAISPDGMDVAFTTVGSGASLELRRVSLAGGPSLLVADSAIDNGGVSWGWDGYIYTDGALEGDGFARVPESGGSPEIVTTPGEGEDWHASPFALPGGTGVLFYVAGPRSIAVVDTETGDSRILVDGVWGGYSDSGHLLWITDTGTLMAQRFDPDTFELSGRAVPIAEGLLFPSTQLGGSSIAISRSGDLVYVEGSTPLVATRLAWVDRDGAAMPFDSTWAQDFQHLELSPDGSQLAVSIQEGGEEHIWVKPTDGGPARKLTFEGSNRAPAWLPDGEWIGYGSGDGLFRRRADGTGSAVQVLTASSPLRPQWSRDGRWVVYDELGAIWGQPLDGDGLAEGDRVLLVDDSPTWEGMPSLSPNGRWLAFASLRRGNAEIYVRPFPDTDQGNWLVSEGGGAAPRWSADGTELLFVEFRQPNLYATPVRTDEATFAHDRPRPVIPLDDFLVGIGGFGSTTSTPDGDRILARVSPNADRKERLVLIQNVFRLLDEQVGN